MELNTQNRNRLSLVRLLSNIRTTAEDQILAVRQLGRQVPRDVKVFAIILLVSLSCLYWAVILDIAAPTLAEKKVNWFFSPWYSNPIPLKWWMKYFTSDLSSVLDWFAICKMLKWSGNTVFMIGVAFFVYHLLDLIFYLWNFKTSVLVYSDMFFSLFMVLRSIVKGYKKETVAKIKSLF